jgi:hypothetical protein
MSVLNFYVTLYCVGFGDFISSAYNIDDNFKMLNYIWKGGTSVWARLYCE